MCKNMMLHRNKYVSEDRKKNIRNKKCLRNRSSFLDCSSLIISCTIAGDAQGFFWHLT